MATGPTGIFIGRFQPLHNGHFLVLQGMVKVCGKVKIVIGSTQKSGTKKNPFTFEERKEMIQRTLQVNNMIPVYDIEIHGLEDEPNDEAWIEKCIEEVGQGGVCWSGDEKVLKLFKDKGIEVKEIKEVPGISGTEVRKRIANDGDWKNIVPKEVIDVILETDGISRIKKLQAK